MAEPRALDQVFDLARAPGLARKLRNEPLPEGMLQVLRLAAGDEGALRDAADQTGRTSHALRDAAVFYVIQVLLNSKADSYRVLGARSGATRDELRSHMVWLLKWLHPDTTRDSPHAIFASRVIRAWESLRSADQRQCYDATQPTTPVRTGQSVRRHRSGGIRYPIQPKHHRRPNAGKIGGKRWTKRALVSGVVAACLVGTAVLLVTYDPDSIENVMRVAAEMFLPVSDTLPQANATSRLEHSHD